MNVQLFIPCFVDQLFPHTAFNMIKVLEKAGCTVSYNTEQTCCGQPAFNAGFWDESKTVCTKFLKDFKGTDYIVAPSASCVGFVRNYYGKLFENSSLHHEMSDVGKRLHEFSEFMVKVLKVLPHFRKGRDFTLNRRIIFKTGVLNLVSTKNLQVRATDVEIQRTPSFFWHARWYARQRRLRIKTRGIQVPKNHWMGAIIYTAVTGSQLFFSLEFDRSELEKQIRRASSTCTPTRSIALFGCSMPLESPRLVAT